MNVKVVALCKRYVKSIGDPAWQLADALQDARIKLFLLESYSQQYRKLKRKHDKLKYYLRTLNNMFIDYARKRVKQVEAEMRYFG